MTTKIKHGVTEFLPGQVIQSVYAEYTANSDITTVLPLDDTIPQNTEGGEILTASITPKYATSKIRIRFQGPISVSAAGTWVSAALFKDSTASAIAGAMAFIDTAGAGVIIQVAHEESAASVVARTYKIRVGPHAAATVRMNGSPSARFFGGVMRSTLIVEEVAV